ncbi:MAG: hypothetical protein M3337_04070 [Actinomycetota bacterium]|nr:hypothetical protein [Actinomycetota bacterium]
MSRPRNQQRTQHQRRPQGAKGAPPVDIWHTVEPLPEPEDIEPTSDPVAMIRTLGDPPLARHSDPAAHHIAAVVERAAALATALAASADLLAEPDDDARA